MGHETMSNDPRELKGIAQALRRRIREGRIRVGALEEELRRVEGKVRELEKKKNE